MATACAIGFAACTLEAAAICYITSARVIAVAVVAPILCAAITIIGARGTITNICVDAGPAATTIICTYITIITTTVYARSVIATFTRTTITYAHAIAVATGAGRTRSRARPIVAAQ